MVAFRTVADKMLKKELIEWAKKRLDLKLTMRNTKTGMGSRIMIDISQSKIMPFGQATIELAQIYYLCTGKKLLKN